MSVIGDTVTLGEKGPPGPSEGATDPCFNARHRSRAQFGTLWWPSGLLAADGRVERDVGGEMKMTACFEPLLLVDGVATKAPEACDFVVPESAGGSPTNSPIVIGSVVLDAVPSALETVSLYVSVPDAPGT